jgi:hypothetical protein
MRDVVQNQGTWEVFTSAVMWEEWKGQQQGGCQRHQSSQGKQQQGKCRFLMLEEPWHQEGQKQQQGYQQGQ